MGAFAARHRFDSLTVARRAATVLRTAAAGAFPTAQAWEPLSVEP
jgi:hypothetical protein